MYKYLILTSLLKLGKHKRAVGSPKSKAVTHCNFDLLLLRCQGDQVEVYVYIWPL